MHFSPRRCVLILLTAAAAAGCERTPPDGPNDAARALQTALPGEVFRGTLSGKAVHLVAHDCQVFLVQDPSDAHVGWVRVLAPEPYPFFTQCVRQSLASHADGVEATLGRMALGAGGCCATGGTYRSTDGRTWVKKP